MELIQHARYPLTTKQLNQLFADLNPNRIASRKQGGATLSYLEAWDVKAMLIRVFGYGGWSIVNMDAQILRSEKDVRALVYKQDKNAPKEQRKDEFGELVWNWNVTAQVSETLYIHQLGTLYSGVGIASQTGPDHGEVSDFAIKTADSDALKRCAINLGTSFGLSLYDNGSTADVVQASWAPGQTRLDRDVIAQEEAALDAQRKAWVEEMKGVPASTTPVEQPVATPVDPDVARQAGMDKLAGGFGAQS